MNSNRSAVPRPPGQDLILCLTFHGIGDPHRKLQRGEADVWCSAAEMEAVLDVVAGRSNVRITSDDGNRSDIDLLAPALVRRGLTGTFFVLAGRLGKTGFLNKADMRDLLGMGMTVGSHGWDHVPWRRMPDDVAERELTTARRTLEDACGTTIREAACPFGAYDRATLRRLGEEGFKRIYSSDGGWTRESERPLARNSVGQHCGESVVRVLVTQPGIESIAALKRLVKRWR